MPSPESVANAAFHPPSNGTSPSPQAPVQEEPNEAPPKANPESMTLEQLEFSVLGLYGTSNRTMFIEHLFAGSAAEYKIDSHAPAHPFNMDYSLTCNCRGSI